MGVATATALVGAGISAYSAINEANKKKKAAKALKNLPTPETSNVAESLTVSTRGADLRKEEAGRSSASAIDALRSSGTRGVIGGVGKVVAENNAVSADIGANLDEQQKDIDRMKAGDNVRIQGVREQRYQSDVAGLSSQIDSAQDAQNQGIANTIQGLGNAGQAYSDYRADSGLTPEQRKANRMSRRASRKK